MLDCGAMLMENGKSIGLRPRARFQRMNEVMLVERFTDCRRRRAPRIRSEHRPIFPSDAVAAELRLLSSQVFGCRRMEIAVGPKLKAEFASNELPIGAEEFGNSRYAVLIPPLDVPQASGKIDCLERALAK